MQNNQQKTNHSTHQQQPFSFWNTQNFNPFGLPLADPHLSRYLSPFAATQWIDYQLQPNPHQQYQGYPFDLNSSSSRRKNATRENTAILKKWLNENMSNPYPTKTQKTHLATMTGMSLVQVATWFANARRRLKKENKMTWEPKSRFDEAAESGNDRESESVLSEELADNKLLLLKRPEPIASSQSFAFGINNPPRKRVKFSSIDELAQSDCIDNLHPYFMLNPQLFYFTEPETQQQQTQS